MTMRAPIELLATARLAGRARPSRRRLAAAAGLAGTAGLALYLAAQVGLRFFNGTLLAVSPLLIAAVWFFASFCAHQHAEQSARDITKINAQRVRRATAQAEVPRRRQEVRR
jgi:hypothetical protein